MADNLDKNPLNVVGSLYNDLSCIDCGMCPMIAPSTFRRDDIDALSYVFKQPEVGSAEMLLAIEAMESCPTESIGLDGDIAKMS